MSVVDIAAAAVGKETAFARQQEEVYSLFEAWRLLSAQQRRSSATRVAVLS
jgi:hypothetical protein